MFVSGKKIVPRNGRNEMMQKSKVKCSKDEDEDDETGSGNFPPEFDGAYGRNGLNTDDQDFFKNSRKQIIN